MTTRKQIAIVVALVSIACIVSCLFLLPPIFPTQPPADFHRVQAGMHIDEAKAIFGNKPNVLVDDKKIENGVVIEQPLTWMHWPVHDGLIQVAVNKQDRVEMVFFQPSRSSVVENLQEMWRWKRFLS